MNIGNEVRAMHADFILEQLRNFARGDTQFRETEFTVREVKPGAR
jgi:hypothetical protein